MQEKSIPDMQKAQQMPPPLGSTTTKAQGVSVGHLLGTLRLNLTQPECSDGRGNL